MSGSNVNIISQTGIKHREDGEQSLRLNSIGFFPPIINLSLLTLTAGASYFKRHRIWWVDWLCVKCALIFMTCLYIVRNDYKFLGMTRSRRKFSSSRKKNLLG
jgi:hypothetical protein